MFSIDNGTVDASDIGCAMSEVTFKFVDIIGAFPASARVLTVNGIYHHPTRTYTENERILKSM